MNTVEIETLLPPPLQRVMLIYPAFTRSDLAGRQADLGCRRRAHPVAGTLLHDIALFTLRAGPDLLKPRPETSTAAARTGSPPLRKSVGGVAA